MRANVRLFAILAGFFALATIVYVIWNIAYEAQGLATTPLPTNNHDSPIEWAGTVALGLTAVLAALISFYLGRAHGAQGGELPEDRVNAEIDDGDAEQGFFSPWSWWPVTLGGALALAFTGLATGVWLAFFAAPLVLIAVVGWNYEYYRRAHSH